MAYWKWRAYNNNAEEFNGVDEASRFELVALRICQRGLTPGPIDRITYDQYQPLKLAESKLNKLRALKSKLQPNVEIPQNALQNHNFTKLFVTGIFLTLLLLTIGLYLYYK